MNYPFWDIDIGYGWLMGSIAILHVFISHFAIGGGLYLVISETIARKKTGVRYNGEIPVQEALGTLPFELQFLQRLSKFFVLASVVLGALTGVGIWFIIGLLNPAATEVLIHHFVWAWATEWTFFIVEIAAALIYYYGWKTMSARNHIVVGWIYFAAAWLSLAMINGIVAFMLTPGDWLQTGNFWDGIFNPTYWSALVFRTGVCVMLAGIYALAVAAFLKPDKAKASLIRYNAVWAVVGLVIMAPSYRWYYDSIPETIRTAAIEKMPTVVSRISEGWWLGMALTAVVILFGLVIPRWYHWVVGVMVMTLGLVVFGEYEWMREAIRKPYVIHGYMYGNAVEVSDVDHLQADGMLPHITYRTNDDGADLFRRACRSCHTMDGYKALKPRFDGTDEAFIATMGRGVGVMRGNMPPFVGTTYESELIAAHVYSQTDHRSLSEIHGLSGVELGRKVYEIRCGSCHQFDGYSDKASSLTGLTDDDYNNLLDLAGELADEMPDFTASDEERAALIEYLKTLPEGGAR